jgi:hypothetical protein
MSGIDSDDAPRELIHLDGVPSLHGYPVDPDMLRLSHERRQRAAQQLLNCEARLQCTLRLSHGRVLGGRPRPAFRLGSRGRGGGPRPAEQQVLGQ